MIIIVITTTLPYSLLLILIKIQRSKLPVLATAKYVHMDCNELWRTSKQTALCLYTVYARVVADLFFRF